ncbi:MAG: hypothetical protein FWG18_01895, partial [Alphaproteobacteria bacterium]|nr:hypothetical protein [Alphaproteobacteria bacterium]
MSKTIPIFLVGAAGKMAKIIKKQIEESNGRFKLTGQFDIKDGTDLSVELARPESSDAVIFDFTNAAAFLENLSKYAARDVITGTTGWYDSIDSVRDIVKKNNIKLMYAGNFSLGLNMIFYPAVLAAIRGLDALGNDKH